ncbi:uncharacterized protein PHALS_08358 [Plasmopara halstedii]|uniref:Uncharacterized protein n=1 Tax=Plasmopara halstedii TaxID=4781 RepID=A0A0N7L4C3_PLAHL|nr:uncharacterized protein PHALS_08358 [Plasmopara halstedii]CEG38275.1 hypothetical protein PHALS_08358 [Plasmopara halstedii]|eukprot:XP_024574644.1 hypothetical protein PHALS_08358 [Plasmopara halstedii]
MCRSSHAFEVEFDGIETCATTASTLIPADLHSSASDALNLVACWQRYEQNETCSMLKATS